MRAIAHLLEETFFRYGLVGVAFITPASSSMSFGEPCGGARRWCDGMSQWHDSDAGVATFVSYFGRDRYLVARYACVEDKSMIGAPGSFMRLACAIQRALDEPMDGRDDAGGVRVPKDRGPRPKTLSAQVSLDQNG